ncbi:MAG: LLM class flavin-dependent oxidoreductase [Bacteroidales bacterium]|nr:LLM class flavin-dependent oxidoreductase [Bacteroidales bacterium]
MNRNATFKNEVKANIIRSGFTMQEVVEKLADEYGWSSSVSNFSGKLSRGSLRYLEAVELADALGYEIVWQRKGR